RRDRIARPVDSSRFRHKEGPVPAPDVRGREVERSRDKEAVLEAPDRDEYGLERGRRDFVPVQAALARVAQAAAAGRPDPARIRLLRGLHHRDAPLRLAIEDGPVERMGAAVADDAGM